MDCVLGLDIGTTSTIGILIAPPNNVLAQASRPVTLSSPYQGWAEEDPQQWWLNVGEIIPELIARAGVTSDNIKAVAVTGMLPAVVLLDKDDAILRPSIQQSDGRCGREVEEIAGEISAVDFVAKSGNGINQQLVAAKLRWIEKNEADIFSRIDTVFGSYDYINWKLCGEKAVEQNWALEAGFVDLANHELSSALIELAHIPRTAIPRKVNSHETLGHVNLEAAEFTGLAAGTPVVGGVADHIASAYAAGITSPGDVLLKFGGSTDIMIATEQAVPDSRMFLDYHLIPGMYMPNGCMASGGSALNWFTQQFAGGLLADADQQNLSLHQYLDQLAEEIPAGSDGVQITPYFLGEKTPIHDPDARGSINGLSLNHGASHLWRALLEGFAYAFRHHIEVFNDMGHPTTHFLASDGGSNSRLWMQICADVLQQPIETLSGHPGSCLGAAWLAVIGAGLSDDWAGVSEFVSIKEHFEPNPEHAAIYEQGYCFYHANYQATSEATQKCFDEH